VPTQRGAVQVNWQAAATNGRPITTYMVEAPSGTQQVRGTSVVLTGYPDDSAVQVKVHAVNEAGNGPDATATGRTIGVPTVTVTGGSPDYNSIAVTFTPNNKGGAASCLLHVDGVGDTGAVNCTTQPVTLTMTGLLPNKSYTYTVRIDSPAGGGTAGGAMDTFTLRATVVCSVSSYCGSGIYIYSVPSQSNPGNAVGRYYGGNTFVPECHVANNPEVNASPWGGKRTNVWLKVDGQNRYFPWAWSVLDGGDVLGRLPACS
jgi:hypothetical protein